MKTMTVERRAEIVKILEDSASAIYDAVAGVSEQESRLSPVRRRWNVSEIAEHIALGENGMFKLLGTATLVEESLEDPAKEAALKARMESPDIRSQAPERAQPSGRFGSVSQALIQFTEARDRTLEFARTTETDLFRLSIRHPLFGAVNGFEMLLIMAGHSSRHARQIQELKRSLV